MELERMDNSINLRNSLHWIQAVRDPRKASNVRLPDAHAPRTATFTYKEQIQLSVSTATDGTKYAGICVFPDATNSYSLAVAGAATGQNLPFGTFNPIDGSAPLATTASLYRVVAVSLENLDTTSAFTADGRIDVGFKPPVGGDTRGILDEWADTRMCQTYPASKRRKIFASWVPFSMGSVYPTDMTTPTQEESQPTGLDFRSPNWARTGIYTPVEDNYLCLYYRGSQLESLTVEITMHVEYIPLLDQFISHPTQTCPGSDDYNATAIALVGKKPSFINGLLADAITSVDYGKQLFSELSGLWDAGKVAYNAVYAVGDLANDSKFDSPMNLLLTAHEKKLLKLSYGISNVRGGFYLFKMHRTLSDMKKGEYSPLHADEKNHYDFALIKELQHLVIDKDSYASAMSHILTSSHGAMKTLATLASSLNDDIVKIHY